MKKIILILILSILLLLGTCVACGFYNQILQTGFDPTVLFAACIVIFSIGTIGSSIMLIYCLCDVI